MSNDVQALLARIESLEAKVQEVRDREEICNLKTRYAEACDLGYNADAMVELFTPDAVWEFTNEWGAHRGHREIHQFMVTVGKQITWALHFMIGPTIKIVTPTQATGKWYILELATMIGLENPDGRDAVVLSGTYSDVYAKVDGTWKFKHVKVNIGQCSNLADGWVKQPLRGS
jgi:SnoaL-like domain